MSLTEKIAIAISNSVKESLNIDEEKEEIIIYGAINLLQIIFGVLWVIIVSIFFGVLCEALIFSITVSIFRKYSGGVHASSPSRCTIIGTTLAVATGSLLDKILYTFTISTAMIMSMVFIIFAFIIVFKNAPVDSINKPIINIEARKQFKMKSIFVIFIFSFLIITFFILNQKFSELYYIKLIESISLGVLWQTITLTKSGIRFLNRVDFILKYIIEIMGASITSRVK